MNIIKCAVIGFILGALLASVMNSIVQFDRDSRATINQPVMIFGDE